MQLSVEHLEEFEVLDKVATEAFAECPSLVEEKSDYNFTISEVLIGFG
jgi:hypothetical protein